MSALRRLARRVLPVPLRRPLGRVYRASVRRADGLRQRARPVLRRVRAVVPERRTEGIRDSVLASRRRQLTERRTYGPHDLDRLATLLRRADEVVTLAEGYARREDWPERFIALRHDMDHDVENSLRLAEWEAGNGFRSTFFVLHTDWYWGEDQAGEPSPFVLRALDRIAELGHEIGIHNNAITAALQTGQEPVAILDRALTALRRHGFSVTGSVAHGDPLCHKLGYVNSEIFAECPRPALGAPDRVITWPDAPSGTASVRLRPVPMADLGLTYEANLLGHTLYLSDTGGKWNVPFDSVDDRFEREGGFLQILVHPVWWALSGEAFTPRPTVVPATADEVLARAAGDPSAPPFRIVVRGDCCSRRAIDMNRDLFGGNPVMVRDEKARTDFFLDHLAIGSATPDDVRHYMDVDAMGRSLRTYALGQTDRSTLEVDDAQLLVIDDYSDMNFAAWRHRQHGWKMWVHPAYIRDREAFERDFEPVGQLSYEETLQRTIQLIEEYRRRNGHIPVMYLHQPIAYYRKLEPRSDFRRLGLDLERAVPDLYFGDIHESELEPDDMGSCGPGQTLHFTGPTYRKMIQVALDKGLSRWLARRAIATPS